MTKGVRVSLTILFVVLVIAGPTYFFIYEKLHPPLRTEFTETDRLIVEKLLGFDPVAYLEVEALDRGKGNDYWYCICVVFAGDLREQGRFVKATLPSEFNFWSKCLMFMYADDIRKMVVKRSNVYLARIPMSTEYDLLIITGEWNKVISVLDATKK